MQDVHCILRIVPEEEGIILAQAITAVPMPECNEFSQGKYSLSTKLATTSVAVLVGLTLCELFVRWLDLAPAVKPIMISDRTTIYKRSTNPVLGFELKVNHHNPAVACAALECFDEAVMTIDV